MTTRRTARVNRAIQEAVSTAVLFKVKDPRVKNVTVLRAEATDDLRSAKVYVSVMGDEKRQALTMNGLAAARGFLQSKVADRLQTKQTPILTFVLDQTVKQNAAAQAALAHLFPVPEGGEGDETETDVSSDDEVAHAGMNLNQNDDEFDVDDEDDEDDEFDLDEDFETEDLSTIDGAGAEAKTTEAEVHTDIDTHGQPSSAGAGKSSVRENERPDVNAADESEPAELEENEDLPSR